MILYHGTMAEHVKDILTRGLRMRREIPDEPSLPARICLTDDYDEAKEWGDGTVVTVDVPTKWSHKTFSDVDTPKSTLGTPYMREYWIHHTIPPGMIVRIDTPQRKNSNMVRL